MPPTITRTTTINTYNRVSVPTCSQKFHKIMSYPGTWTFLLVSAINGNAQADVSTKACIILLHESHMYNIKNVQ